MSDLLPILRAAVHERLGGKVGAVLSGGLDSSTVVRLAHERVPWMPTFTGYYALKDFDETKYARMVASESHYEILITANDVVRVFDDVMRIAPRPLQGPGMIGQYIVAEYASRHVDVVLSGEGSDELFGGYARQMIVAGVEPPTGYENYRLPDDYPRDLEAALAYDLERLPDLLAVDDAMCAAHGLEARAPFTDEQVVDYALSLPASERVGKTHLREAVRGLVPDAIIDRKDKKGFPIPLVYWAQDKLRDWVQERIGYIPPPEKPWDRSWWHDLCEASMARL